VFRRDGSSAFEARPTRPGRPESPPEQLAAPIPDDDVPRKHSSDHEAEHVLERDDSCGDQRDRVAEEISESQPGARPQEYAGQIIENETSSCDREHAGQGWNDRGDAGNELRDKDARCAVASEDLLSPARTRVGLEG
jgi:hypothetical protein